MIAKDIHGLYILCFSFRFIFMYFVSQKIFLNLLSYPFLKSMEPFLPLKSHFSLIFFRLSSHD